MFRSTSQKLYVLKSRSGIVDEEKYSLKQRFKMLMDIEKKIRNSQLELSDVDLGKMLDVRDRFQMHYLKYLTKNDYYRLTKMFDYFDDIRYIYLINQFLKTLSSQDNAVRCPKCNSLIFPDIKGHFPCPNCFFKPNKDKKTHFHCQFVFGQE